MELSSEFVQEHGFDAGCGGDGEEDEVGEEEEAEARDFEEIELFWVWVGRWCGVWRAGVCRCCALALICPWYVEVACVVLQLTQCPLCQITCSAQLPWSGCVVPATREVVRRSSSFDKEFHDR